jgi:hypothetical protein
MSVHVMSIRKFQIEETEKMISLLAELSSRSKKQPGHISRETLRSLDNPGEYLVRVEWETAESWDKWPPYLDSLLKGFTTNTGTSAVLTTLSATEPKITLSMPLRPWVPMIIKSIPSFLPPSRHMGGYFRMTLKDQPGTKLF